MENNKSKIVHQWNIQPISEAEAFLEDYSHCSLCGEELVFTHVTHFLYGQVDEEAECPSCQVRMKKQSHSLQ
jgi:hypothetical protein